MRNKLLNLGPAILTPAPQLGPLVGGEAPLACEATTRLGKEDCSAPLDQTVRKPVLYSRKSLKVRELRTGVVGRQGYTKVGWL